jgi:4-aminobutyrate aminotransferase-like enzyme
LVVLRFGGESPGFSGPLLVALPGYLHGVQELCRRHGIVTIADVVVGGLGRLGDWFSVERFGLEPDLIVFAKGITSGALSVWALHPLVAEVGGGVGLMAAVALQAERIEADPQLPARLWSAAREHGLLTPLVARRRRDCATTRDPGRRAWRDRRRARRRARVRTR